MGPRQVRELDPRRHQERRHRGNQDPERLPDPEGTRSCGWRGERIEAEAGRKLSDRELERLIDEVIATNEGFVDAG